MYLTILSTDKKHHARPYSLPTLFVVVPNFLLLSSIRYTVYCPFPCRRHHQHRHPHQRHDRHESRHLIPHPTRHHNRRYRRGKGYSTAGFNLRFNFRSGETANKNNSSGGETIDYNKHVQSIIWSKEYDTD